MRRACIDIGSNTTRLLVADSTNGILSEVDQRRTFTHLRRALARDGHIGETKIAEMVEVVREQLIVAQDLGAEEVALVATAAVRQASDRSRLVGAVLERCGCELRILSEAEEARLAFLGACGALGRSGAAPTPGDELGVVDVGGGSSELVVGAFPDHIRWSASLALGSGVLADACFETDPPAEREMERAAVHVESALGALEVPRPARAVAVGGSAASLYQLAGPRLDGRAFTAALALLLGLPADEVARRYGLAVDRVRLLPGGLVILRAVHEHFGVPLELVGGGLREGVLLDLAGAGGS